MFKRVLIILLFANILLCGCSNNQVKTKSNSVEMSIPNNIINGYEKADFDMYNSPGKVNGLKYKKIYVIGKLINEIKETSESLNCDFEDLNNKIWFLRLDKPRSSNIDKYVELIGKDVCVVGIYGGSLIKNPKPVIYVNRIYDYGSKEEITSKFYENYYGEFDENGKVISSDFDSKDNTQIDFHKLQVEIPYNYKEAKISNDEYIGIVYDDGIFYMKYILNDLTKISNDWTKKYEFFNSIQKDNSLLNTYYSYLDNLSISSINYNAYEGKLSFDITTNSANGKGALMISEDGIYTVVLLSDNSSRFNRENDFSKIIKSTKILEQSKPVRSYGVNKEICDYDNDTLGKFIHNKEEYSINDLNSSTVTYINESTLAATNGSIISNSKKNALKSAQDYLNYSAFSYSGLIKQLEFENYSHEDATYAADNCGADWNEQAVKSARGYLNYSSFSLDGLISQLEFEGFTSSQAKYGANAVMGNSITNSNSGGTSISKQNALKSAKSYLNYSAFSYTGLIEQLEFEKYSYEDAVYAADNCGADWNEQAAKSARSYLNYSSFSRQELIDQLLYEGFTNSQAEYGVRQNGY